jgi:16S rRNA C1402 (ribose-2'-O) methylase RsmI
MTKLHEEFIEGSAGEVHADFASRAKILGEFAIFVFENKNAQQLDISTDNEGKAG